MLSLTDPTDFVYSLRDQRTLLALMWVEKHELAKSRDNLMNPNGNDIFFSSLKFQMQMSQLSFATQFAVEVFNRYGWHKK